MFSSFIMMASVMASTVVVIMNTTLYAKVLRIIVNAASERNKNSKFLKPHQLLLNGPLI